MNYTENYHLPQWKESDRIMMNDFNQMCLDIESGIDSAKAEANTSSQALSDRITAAQTAAGNAQTAANNAKTAADNAQTAADTAQTAADKAQTAADKAQTAADKAQTAANKAQTTANTAQTAANTAQTTADNAQTAANTAQSTADSATTAASAAQSTADTALAKATNAYSPNQKPYVVGSYVGTGNIMRIYIGFKPSFVIISGQTIEESSPAVLLATGPVNNGLIQFFIDYLELYPAVGYYPNIVLKGRTYRYIAFR